MSSTRLPDPVFEYPTLEEPDPDSQTWPSHPGVPPGSPDMLHREKPTNQAAFHEWVRATYSRVFGCEKQLDGPIFPVEAPLVKGLTVYGAKNGETRFYGAWTERSGVFIGWMKIQPHIAGVDSDYAVGEILGRSVFEAVSIDLSGHAAVDRFVLELREVAWELGVAEG
jgi:hypothetical protein